MAAQWTADVVGKMHLNGITIKLLAGKLGYTHEWVGKVLSGKKSPANAEQTFRKALDELIAEKSVLTQ